MGSKAYMKIKKNNSITLPDHCFPVLETKKKNQDNLILMWSVLLASSVFVDIIFIVAICVGVFSIYRKKLKTPMRNFGSMEMNLRCFTYQGKNF